MQNDEEKKVARQNQNRKTFDVCIPSIKRNAHSVDR